MPKNSIAAQLRKDVDRAKGPEAGTVIRFESVSPDGCHECEQRRYTYAAVFVNDRWYLTGSQGFFGTHSFTHDQFVANVLAKEDIENIFVATDFEAV